MYLGAGAKHCLEAGSRYRWVSKLNRQPGMKGPSHETKKPTKNGNILNPPKNSEFWNSPPKMELGESFRFHALIL